MKVRREIFRIGITFLAAFTAFSGALALSTRASADPGQETFASIKDVPPFAYCCIPHKGPLTEISNVIGQLVQSMQSQNIFSTVRGPMLGVYYNVPGRVKPEELSWEVGFPVIEQAMPQ